MSKKENTKKLTLYTTTGLVFPCFLSPFSQIDYKSQLRFFKSLLKTKFVYVHRIRIRETIKKYHRIIKIFLKIILFLYMYNNVQSTHVCFLMKWIQVRICSQGVNLDILKGEGHFKFTRNGKNNLIICYFKAHFPSQKGGKGGMNTAAPTVTPFLLSVPS